jgi:hypothetical protein
VFKVVFHPAAERELERLPKGEQVAIAAAVEKLRVDGPMLRAPHQSAVRGALSLRELRPRAGRSAWRALYRRVTEDTFVIAAIGPEAVNDRRGFGRAVGLAEQRLGELE